MEIYNKDFFKIFETNFEYELVDTPLGKAVKMPANDAFIFSSITGAGYLDNPHYPFTPKGLTKVFYSALHYQFVTGIFDGTTLAHTPYLMSVAKPYLFSGDKYIVPIEFQSDAELSEKVALLYNTVENPYDYVIQRLECWKKGNGMEPFLEYLTASYFKKQGFIVETQIPLSHSDGSPDFAGFKITDVQKVLSDTDLDTGFHVIELAMLRQTNGFVANDINSPSETTKLIVGEAKTSTSVMDAQLNKYLNFTVFDEGYEITALRQNPSDDAFGLVTINEDYKIVMTPPLSTSAKTDTQTAYIEWLQNYLKFYLIANLTQEEFVTYVKDTMGATITTQKDVSEFVINQSMNDILSYIKKVVTNGTIE